MTILFFLLVLTGAGLGGYALLVRAGLDDLEAWAGGRVAGLVLAAMPAWWAGVVGVHQWRTVGAVVLFACAVVGGVVAWRRKAWRQLLVAEAIFWVATAAVIFLRLDHPQIVFTEKPMDMGILGSLLRAESFPPPDMWLAGETLPYYYWGALLWTVPLAIASVPLEIGYNLIVALVGGMVASLLWMLGRRAGGSHWSGLLVAFFGLFAGTPDGMRQLFAGASIGDLDFWHSSRQITDTITEFPLFTIHLGDLHPHLLSMPIACLALLVAWQAGRAGPKIIQTVVLAILFGVAWAANPWSMPPTIVGIALLLFAGPERWYWPVGDGRRRWLAVAVIAVGGWMVTAPFHLNFKPFFQGVKMVFAWTAPGDLLLYAGCLLVPAALAALALLRPIVGGKEEVNRAIALLTVAAVLVVAAASGRPTLVMLASMSAVFVIATLGPLSGADRPVFALAALGIFLFLVPEIVYVADNYGADLHRMNTVFKSYIQAWILVAVALPVLLRWGIKRRSVRLALVAVMVAVALPHLTGMTVQQMRAKKHGLDGMGWMTAGDRAIVHFLREQPPGTVIVEAVGDAYSEYARLSSASGVPAHLGWANHESVWRGGEILEETNRRRDLMIDIYTSGDAEEIREAVEEAGIHLVAIGSLERKDFSDGQLARLAAAGEVVLDQDGGLVVRFGAPVDGGAAVGADMMEP